jgi:hypothetical protein
MARLEQPGADRLAMARPWLIDARKAARRATRLPYFDARAEAMMESMAAKYSEGDPDEQIE